ncbi:5-methyltetrahydropteroyltriglutamate--homocysteine S-methyltransferase [Bacillus spizizenii ATCC 6633 = JCM 2499]|uniref:Putative methyl-tetrahydrofolate methyltransferase n=1 Tax=Bacillus spizizenii (strain ATCC 23059 / NRRL B-14472 / W23) TaxID=655816 RepID=E0TXF3_BACSH|nr:5-methyltetrahydropteroyltriglutamate--homocysteine S-methyltransferase [Bacillus spizizenii]KFI02422.1 methionine synthase [Bacillus sp. BSC154]MDU7575064.1 5-methyltetrahydropteroyltriglutamate--homocysteine S-methyltransferase [Bacillus subtilis]ADM39897.1 putative methyl-tetrahydrofolate methyltransferase [Bacillus spizizenii str. W23]AJW85338.1 methionine synthase [Bacillus spizizenii]EFG93712.1 putative methyl-tetrahydrofolate methyltransferase [Bacillus spizizenii ATCC 6633 = JCM 249
MAQQTNVAGQKTEKQRKAPFRADHVGSLLRSAPVKEARQKKAAGEITADQLRDIENQEITRIVEKQKEIGLDVVTDGEFRRSWWHYDFLEGLDGVEAFIPAEGIQFHHAKTKARSIKVTGKLDFTSHPALADYQFLHEIAGDATPKLTIPSPNMLFFGEKADKGIYDDQEEYFHDLAQTYKKAIKAFYDAGCRYLQLDDTSWSLFFEEKGREVVRALGGDPETLPALFAKTINDAVADRPDDLAITMHICRGNFRSTWAASGGYDAVAEIILDGLNLDGLFLEYDDDRSGNFDPLRFVKRKNLQIVLGLITSKYGELENPEDVKRRINEAARFVSLDQLCLSPQCGFASTEEGNLLTEEQQWAKLRHVIDIANDVWR